MNGKIFLSIGLCGMLSVFAWAANLEPTPREWHAGELTLLALDAPVYCADTSLHSVATLVSGELARWSGQKGRVEAGTPPADTDTDIGMILTLDPALKADEYRIAGNHISGGSADGVYAGVQLWLQWLATGDAEWFDALVEYPALNATGEWPSERKNYPLAGQDERAMRAWARLLYPPQARPDGTIPEKTERFRELYLDRPTRIVAGDVADWGSDADAFEVQLKGVTFLLDTPATLGHWPEDSEPSPETLAVTFPARQVQTFYLWHETGAVLPPETPVALVTVQCEDGTRGEYLLRYGVDLAAAGAWPETLDVASWRCEGFVTELRHPVPGKDVTRVIFALRPEAAAVGYRLNALTTSP